MIKNLILILFMLFIIGCSSSENYDDKKFYRLRMKIDNMGRVRYGIGVFKDKPLYTFEFTSLGKMDYFSFNSCSTNISRVNAGGLIFKRKTTKVNWRPNEVEKNCDVTITTTEKIKHRHTSGYIVFMDDRFKLEGVLMCGSKTDLFEGVSVCQNYDGNKNKIEFQEPTIAYSKNCKVPKAAQKEFVIATPLGFCNYIFVGQLSKRKHRMVTYGYNDDLLI